MADIPAIVNYQTKFCAENMQPVFNVCYGALDMASTPADGRTALDVYSKAETATLSYVNGTFLKTSGGTMSGPLDVTAGATGDQAMRASEIAALVAGVTNTASKTSPGWWKCEKTGIIIQWGPVTGTDGYQAFPITFPTDVFTCVIAPTFNVLTSSEATTAQLRTLSAAGFDWSNRGITANSVFGANITSRWIAIGC